MKKKDWFIINDLEEFINATRALVFNNFGRSEESDLDDLIDQVSEQEMSEFNTILSYDESLAIAKSILKEQINKKTLAKRYVVSDALYMDLIESLNARMVGNILNNLVNKGLVETAFDEKSNDFIFWCIDDENKKPETD